MFIINFTVFDAYRTVSRQPLPLLYPCAVCCPCQSLPVAGGAGAWLQRSAGCGQASGLEFQQAA